MTRIKGQKLRSSYYTSLEKDFQKAFFDIIFAPVYAPLKKLFDKQNIFLENQKTFAIERALKSGQIQFIDGVFSGKFSASIGKELRDIGAVFDKRRGIYKIKLSDMPDKLKVISANSNDLIKKAIQSSNASLNETLKNLDSLIDTVDINYSQPLDLIESDFNETVKATDIITISEKDFIKNLADKYSQNVKPTIKDWAEEEILKLRGLIEQNVIEGYRSTNLIEKIKYRFDVSTNKAKSLARQETSLLKTEFRKERFTQAGVTSFEWSSSKDVRVRPYHRFLDGKIFSYSNPPIINPETGQKGLPGQDFGCRCVDIALLS